MEEKETLTTSDLTRVFIRAQNAEGRWITIDCKEATDVQFNVWAHTRRPIEGEPGPWSLRERADFCNQLWQARALVILKKDLPTLKEERP